MKNPWEGLGSLPRNVWIISIASLINRSGVMVIPFLSLYVTSQLEVSPSDAGLVLLSFGLGALISAPFVGKLSDMIGSLRLMKLSLVGSGIFLFLYSMVTDFYVFLALTFVWSVISESFRPAAMSFLSDETDPEERKQTFALYRLAINLGMSIGPVIGGILYAINFSLLFYVDALTSITAGLFLIFIPIKIKEHKHAKSEDETLGDKPLKKSILPDLHYLYFLAAILPVSMVYMQHLSTMPLFVVKDLGYTTATFGVLTAINTVLIILIEIPLNNWMKHWKHWRAIAFGSLLTAIGFGGMAFTSEVFGLAVTIIIWTFGEMITFPSFAAFAADLSPKNRRGYYMGFYQMAFGLSFTIGPWLGTVVYDDYGYKMLWYATFFVSILSVLMILRLRKDEN